jgi:peptidoglycan/LPS O-acetylase OafA/YrhL
MLKPNAGRALSAAGAILLLVSLVLVWYHVERPTGIEDSTGWDAFPRLRLIVGGGALLLLASALVPQTRWVLVARTALGLVVAALILRRIIDPPDISSPVTTQFGVYVALAGAIMAAIGGLVDSGRELVALGEDRQLPPGPGDGDAGNRFLPRDAPTTGAAVHVPNHAEHKD